MAASETDWNQVRNTDIAEKCFWMFDRVSSMNFAVMAEGHQELQQDRLNGSIQKTAASHFFARCRISEDGENILHNESIQIPLTIKQFKPEPPAQKNDVSHLLAEEVMKPFTENSASIRMILYKTDENRSADPDSEDNQKFDNERWILTAIFHHSLADGRSGVKFLLDVLRDYYASGPLSNAKPEPPPGIHSLFPVDFETKLPEIANRIKARPMPDRLPFFSKRKENSSPILYTLIFSRKVTEWVNQCREHQVTMHGLIAAAQIVSMASLFEDDDNHTIHISSPVDLRKITQNPTQDLSLQITLANTVVQATRNASIWDLAHKVTTDLRNQYQNQEALSFYRLLPDPADYIHKPDPGRLYGAIMQRFPVASVLSNTGVISDDGLENIDNVSFTVHPAVNQSLFTAVSTFRNTLTLNINFDANRWPEDKRLSFVQSMQNILS